MRTSSFLGGILFFLQNIVPERIEVLSFHLSLQNEIKFKEGKK